MGRVHHEHQVRQCEIQKITGPSTGPTEQVPLFGFDYRFNERSYAEDQTDMWTGYAGEVRHAGRDTGRADTVHIREQTQIERDQPEDGAEDSGSLEDEAGGLPGPCTEHLHEARRIMMDTRLWIWALVIVALIFMGNLGGLWLVSTL